MSDELLLNGKTYVSSKRAAEQTGYARDYIGQLSRGGMIDAERVGGLWYVSLESLQNYEKNAEIAKSLTPVATGSKEPESSLSFEGKEYISASRASKLTGYNQDYVGQLARGGKIPSRQIGNRWYVDRDALVSHKAEKDALLAAVQSESVGLRTPAVETKSEPLKEPEHILVLPQMTYTQEDADLMPQIRNKEEKEVEKPRSMYPMSNFSEIRPRTTLDAPLPVIETRSPITHVAPQAAPAIHKSPLKRTKKRSWGKAVAALTIILVLAVGFTGLQKSGTLATLQKSDRVQNMGAAAAEATGNIGDIIENWVSPLIVYHREK